MPDYKTLMQKALSEIKDLRAQLQKQQNNNNNNEPIAIIGMGCRFPGDANTPEAFWELLVNGIDTISEVPSDRWNIEEYYHANPATPGKMHTRYGGFVDGLKEFDADFFGISPREANSLDPQQRLLLEVTWEALERAGVIPHTEASKNTGVFVGISSNDYSQLLLERDHTEIDAYLATGNSHSTAAGRISYLLGFTAPSMAVDTACSSSLVAIHLACKSLRDGECNIAVTGGVHRLIIPEFTINFSQARMLATNGRCKTFDADADGFSRGEGCGMVVLKRLADAEKNGDRILAVIKGSAVNQDGNSSGLTVPNGVSQQKVINQALANSRVEAKDISYIEAHGTGTSLGDPIEINALGEVFKRNKTNPLPVGSVKTNIGHLEAAAGIAGLIKVVLSLQHEQIPPHLHFNQPNPHIDWDNVGVDVVSKRKDWKQNHPRLAGISSFGFSGTNAHLVVGEAREQGAQRSGGAGEKTLHLLTLSAKNKSALKTLAQNYHKYLSTSAPSAPTIKDICYTANVKRSHFEHRLAIISQDIEELNDRLTAFNHNQETPGIYQSVATDRHNKIAFLFTGQGSQYIDMGRELYETQPVFKQNCDRCFQLLEQYLDVPLKEIIFTPAPLHPRTSDSSAPLPLRTSAQINQTQYTQPAIFTIEYALAQMWISWGIKPDVVMGHSIGEFVAATIAGILSLEDAIKLVANRGKLMQELPPNGDMYVIQANEEEVNNIIQTVSGIITIAAINSQENTVISGETAAIENAIAVFNNNNIKTTKLQVSHAFHSPLMESILPAFTKVAKEINYSLPQIPFVSNVTGEKINDSIATPEYWIDHICKPVRFAAGIKTLAELKCNVFLEIGAKPILLGMGRSSLTGYNALCLPSLRHGQSDWRSILSSVASLYTNNINLDWSSFYQNKGQVLSLPTYPFQRQQYWLFGKKKKINNIVGAHRAMRSEFFRDAPLLGDEIKLAKSDSRIWQNQITKDNPGYLTDHQVWQQVIFPTAGYIEIALKAGREVFDSDCLELKNINLQNPIILSDSATEIQFALNIDVISQLSNFEIFSLDNNDNWINNSQGKIAIGSISSNNSNLTKYKQEINDKIDIKKYYQDLAQRGLEYGENFRAIAELYNSENRALGKIELSDNLKQNTKNYIIHPVLLDACLQVAGAAINNKDNSETYLPIEIESFVFSYKNVSLDNVWSYVQVHSYNADIYALNFELINDRQELVAKISGLKIKLTSAKILSNTNNNLEDWLYQIEWRDCPLDEFIDNDLISLNNIKKIAGGKFNELTNTTEFREYLKLLSELENLSIDYIIEALEKLGVDFKEGQLLSPSIEQFGIIEQHKSLWVRILEILTEVKILEETNNVWEIVKIPDRINVDEQNQKLLQQYPIAKAELSLLHRCASQLYEVLNGNIDPKELLFTQGDLSITTSLYQDSPGAKINNELVVEAVKQALINQPKNRKIRILEIGAGTGGTTHYILPHLNPINTKYTFTDVSSLFLVKAREKFQEYDYVDYQLLDISKPSQTQEVYDIIIASNVLHATPNLQQTLNNIQQLLTSQGILILVEGTQPTRWFDLTFGMTEGWWKFMDKSLRANYPLISVDTWKHILLRANFTGITNLCSDETNNYLQMQQEVIVAQASQKSSSDEHYLIFSTVNRINDRQGIGIGISDYFANLNYDYTLVFAGSEYKYSQDKEYQINPLNSDDYNQLIKDLKQNRKKCNRIIYLQSLDGDRNKLELNITNNTNSVLYLTQALIKNSISTTNLCLVTRGAVNLNKEITIEGLGQSSLHGLTKVINLEHPELNCNCIDLDSQASRKQQVENLIVEINSNSKAEQIAWRDRSRKVARLILYQTSQENSNTSQVKNNISSSIVKPNKTYLIAGGLGDLGLLVANWLVEKGANNLLLLGRSKPSEYAQQEINKLEQQGVTVKVIQTDITDCNYLEQTLKSHNLLCTLAPFASKTLPELAGIIHSAGVLDDGMLLNMNSDRMKTVMNPKILGAWNLHQLTKDIQLDFFILFSSAASLLGSPGQINHVAANTFLDALAHYRKAQGLPGLSLNWGAWSDIGAAAKRKVDRQMNLKGISAISPTEGLEILEKLMAQSSPQVGIVPIDWSRFITTNYNLPLFADFQQVKSKINTGNRVSDFLTEISVISSENKAKFLIKFLQKEVGKVLGLSANQLPSVSQGFFDIGMDSLMAIELKSKLDKSLQVTIPSTAIFEHSNINLLANYILNEILDLGQPKTEQTKITEPELSQEELEQAIVQELADLESFLTE